MNLGTQNANNLISKNDEISRQAARNIIDFKDITSFSKLCEKSDFLFDFIKYKIVTNLTNAVTSDNLQNIFEFTKIYNSEFEDFIINSWLKFADEELTDKILELFETGTKEQKAYAAAYFYHINDPLCIEYLEKYAFCDFEPLAQNSAIALRKFQNRKLFNEARDIIQNKDIDDFSKCKYVNFLVSYGDKAIFPIIYNFMENCFIKSFVASNLLYLENFKDLIMKNKESEAFKLFDIITEAYPEEISPETVLDFEVLYFIKFLYKKIIETNSSYLKRLLLKAKSKFNLITSGDIYTYDLDSFAKKEIQSISKYINTLEINLFDNLADEFKVQDKTRVIEALSVILNFGRVEFSDKIAQLLNETNYEEIISEGVKALKVFGKLNLLDKENLLSKIKNENIYAAVNASF